MFATFKTLFDSCWFVWIVCLFWAWVAANLFDVLVNVLICLLDFVLILFKDLALDLISFWIVPILPVNDWIFCWASDLSAWEEESEAATADNCSISPLICSISAAFCSILADSFSIFFSFFEISLWAVFICLFMFFSSFFIFESNDFIFEEDWFIWEVPCWALEAAELDVEDADWAEDFEDSPSALVDSWDAASFCVSPAFLLEISDLTLDNFLSISFCKNLGISEFFKSDNSDFNCFNSVSETEVKLSKS